MIAPQTALDVEREDEVSVVPDVARVDAAFASVEAELTAARATLRAQARVAARSLLEGEAPTPDVRDAIARVGELEAVLVGLGEVRIVERYRGLETLAQDADKAAEALLADAEAADARLRGIERGEIDLGDEAKRSDIPRIDAMRAAEAAFQSANARRFAMLEEASQLRSERAKLKRAHADLFAAEGVS